MDKISNGTTCHITSWRRESDLNRVFEERTLRVGGDRSPEENPDLNRSPGDRSPKKPDLNRSPGDRRGAKRPGGSKGREV